MKTHVRLTQDRVDEIIAWIAKNQPAVKARMISELGVHNPDSLLVEVEKFTKRIYEHDNGRLSLLEDEYGRL